jgi:quinol monooxygenase YgiN
VHARTTTVRAQADAIDAGISYFRDEVRPAVLDIDGSVGMSLLVDRDSGRCIATTSWTDEAAMDAAEQPVQSLRAQAAEHFRGTVEKVERWEIAALHRLQPAGDGAGARCTWLQLPDIERGIDAFRTMVLPRLESMPGFCSGSFFVDRAGGRVVSAIAWADMEALAQSRDGTAELRMSVTERLGGQVLEVAEFELALAHLRVPELV